MSPCKIKTQRTPNRAPIRTWATKKSSQYKNHPTRIPKPKNLWTSSSKTKAKRAKSGNQCKALDKVQSKQLPSQWLKISPNKAVHPRKKKNQNNLRKRTNPRKFLTFNPQNLTRKWMKHLKPRIILPSRKRVGTRPRILKQLTSKKNLETLKRNLRLSKNLLLKNLSKKNNLDKRLSNKNLLFINHPSKSLQLTKKNTMASVILPKDLRANHFRRATKSQC